jgi:hypothetical protein
MKRIAIIIVIVALFTGTAVAEYTGPRMFLEAPTDLEYTVVEEDVIFEFVQGGKGDWHGGSGWSGYEYITYVGEKLKKMTRKAKGNGVIIINLDRVLHIRNQKANRYNGDGSRDEKDILTWKYVVKYTVIKIK